MIDSTWFCAKSNLILSSFPKCFSPLNVMIVQDYTSTYCWIQVFSGIIIYHHYRSSPSKHPWALTVHLEFERCGRLQKQLLKTTHSWIINYWSWIFLINYYEIIYPRLSCIQVNMESWDTEDTFNKEGTPWSSWLICCCCDERQILQLIISQKICWFFLHKGGTIRYTVKDKRRRSSIEQCNLEVTCEPTVSIPKRTKDNETIMSKLRKLLA